MTPAFDDSFLKGRSRLLRSRLSKNGNCMLMLSNPYFELLSSQRDFFQVESIQNYRCRCSVRTISLDRSYQSNSQRFVRRVYRTLAVYCCERPCRHPRWRCGWTPIIYMRPTEAVRAFVTLLFFYGQVFSLAASSSRYDGKRKFLGEKLLCLCMFSFEILFRMRNACFPSWSKEASWVVA